MTKLPLSNIANLQNESTVVTTIATNNAATTAAMENTLSRNGTSPNQMNAALDMNSNRVLNLVDAVDNREPATYNQLKNSITAVGQGSVVNGTYLTLSNDVNLFNNRVLTAGTNIGFADTGPLGTLIIGVNDPELNALALTNSAADTVPYYTGVGTASVTSLPAYGRSLISAVDAATARTTLGSVIGTNVQAWDTDLDAVAGLTTTGLIARTGTGTISTRTVTGTANEITITNGDGVAGNPTASLPAALTFTGKTVTGGSFSSPSITTPTGIVKADVGLGNVDNTSDATKNAATVTLTNKTLTSPVISTITNTGTLTLPTGPETVLGRATTDTLTNKSISGSTNTLSNIALSSHATQAAFTFVGNNTSGAAVPTAVDIATLTTKASPASSDFVMLSDQAASGAWKKATVSTLATAGSVSSIAGNTGAFTLGTGLSNSTNNIINTGVVSVKKQIFTASGTYTPSAGLISAVIEVVGGGGGGGNAAASGAGAIAAAPGGGGGGYSRLYATAATIGVSQTVTVGAAGAGATTSAGNGGTGGTSSVGTLASAAGGGGGNGAPANAGIVAIGGGAGGVPTIGDILLPGGIGGNSFAQPNIVTMGGAGGQGANGSGGAVSAANAAGNSPTGFGGGGGGGSGGTAGVTRNGGNGAPGIVIIMEYCSQ